MRALLIGLSFSLWTAAAAQQVGAPPPSPSVQAVKTFASSADVAALLARAKNDRKEGQPLVAKPILQLAPYTANLEYRASVGNAAVHEHEAEVFYVIDGTATMVVGGKLVNETRPNPENLAGTAIEGGMSRTVAKGDFIIVPENTPHWFSRIDGAIVLMTLHVPRQSVSPR